jgi:Tfp pilus assembly protein PilN
MTQRPSRSFRLRDRSYLITCAIIGAVLVVLAILVLELVVLVQSGKASKAVSPRVSSVAPITPRPGSR